MKTGLNNVVRPTLFTVVNNIDNCEQCGPHDIVQSTILLTTVNNVGSMTYCSILLNSRFIIFTCGYERLTP